MGEATWLKVRSDLYPGAYPLELTNGDNTDTKEIAPETQETDTTETQPQKQPQDWDPNQPCSLCTVHTTHTMGEHHEQHPVSVVSNRNDLSTRQGEPKSPDPPPQDANLPTDEIQVTSDEVSTSSNIISSSPYEVFGTKLGLKLRTDLQASSTCYGGSDDGFNSIVQDGYGGGLDLSATSRASPSLLSGPLSLSGAAPAIGGPLPLPAAGLSRLFPGLLSAAAGGRATPTPQTPLDLYTANLPPHLLPWILSTHLQQLARAHQENSGMLNSPSGDIGISASSSPSMLDLEQKPLDLSAKAHHPLPHHPLHFPTNKIFAEDPLRAKAIVDAKTSPSSRGRRRGDMSKRSYTEEELQAALRDIQSGKLGTRRAAVIYGIPRSTLRNKVYKLAMERERSKKLAEQLTKVESTTSGPLPGLPPITCNPQSQASSLPVPSEDNFQNLLRLRVAEKLEELNQKGQVSLNGAEKDKDQVVESVLKPLMDNIANLALNKDNKELPTDIQSSISFYPQLSNFIKGIVEERYNEELRRSKFRANGVHNISHLEGFKDQNNDLSVPSYSPSCNGGSSEDHARESNITSQSFISSIGNSNLRDMLAQMIGHKGMENGLTTDDKVSKSNCKVSNTLVWDSKTMMLQPQTKKMDSNNSTISGKGSRPKRGKYRNYDRENLLKAVQAVQSGEMSVHRAGSFYGVPHSTLEYKVKERHLNRGKNKKDSASPNDFISNSSIYSLDPRREYSNDASVDATISSTIDLTQDETSNKSFDSVSDIQPALKRVKTESEAISPFTPFSSTSLSSSPLTAPAIPSAPLLSSPFSLWNSPFYASQMMRRIHEIAAKNNPSGQSTSPTPDREQSSSPPFLPQSMSPSDPQNSVQTSVFQGSMLDKLLRSKTTSPGVSESSFTLSKSIPSLGQLSNTYSSPTSEAPAVFVSSSLAGLNKGMVTEQPIKPVREATPPIIQAQELMPFCAFPSLPSMLAVRSTLAAALQRQTTPPHTPPQESTADSPPPRLSSPEVNIMPLPMLKEIPQSTIVGADQP